MSYVLYVNIMRKKKFYLPLYPYKIKVKNTHKSFFELPALRWVSNIILGIIKINKINNERTYAKRDFLFGIDNRILNIICKILSLKL